MGDNKDTNKDSQLGAESPSGSAPIFPIEDDAPLTRSEHKALQDANTTFLLEKMNLMKEGLNKPKDPNGLTDPSTPKVVVAPSLVVNGAKASIPSTEDSDATPTPKKNGMA